MPASRVARPPFLRCVLGCGFEQALGPHFGGCPDCGSEEAAAPLEVVYDYEVLEHELDSAFWETESGSHWYYHALLPVTHTADMVSLGTGNSPLLTGRSIGKRLGMSNLWFKNEAVSPTSSQKDRIQSVNVSMAQRLGYHKVVCISTGNYGASLAAHAAAAGMQALVLCPVDVSPLCLKLIRGYGAHVLVCAWGVAEQMLPTILDGGGWYPAVSLNNRAVSNPYGIEGAKTIAYELFRQCGGTVPDALLLPSASGDTLAGIAKGFNELRYLHRIERVPRLYGCQPTGAPALAQTIAAGLEHVVTLEHPHSVATSTREATTGDLALQAIRASGGAAPTADDAAILDAMAKLGREGLCVEPSSALPVACLAELIANGTIGPSERVVCLLTSSGVKWPDTLGWGTAEPSQAATSVDELERLLSDMRFS